MLMVHFEQILAINVMQYAESLQNCLFKNESIFPNL